jgi:hypothetical protein
MPSQLCIQRHSSKSRSLPRRPHQPTAYYDTSMAVHQNTAAWLPAVGKRVEVRPANTPEPGPGELLIEVSKTEAEDHEGNQGSTTLGDHISFLSFSSSLCTWVLTIDIITGQSGRCAASRIQDPRRNTAVSVGVSHYHWVLVYIRSGYLRSLDWMLSRVCSIILWHGRQSR